MRTRAFLLATIVLLLATAGMAFAGGAGGVQFGTQYFDSRWANTNMEIAYIGGFGYGVTPWGERIGGFGTALISLGQDTAGGVGGLLLGQELRSGPLTVAAVLLGGAGGGAVRGRGYMLLFGEADLELGLALLPWMQVVAYAGYQVWANVVPGTPFKSAALSTPVFGIRIAWGSFR